MDLIVFPNQLFIDHPGLALKPSRIILIEDSLFFGDDQYPCRFHRQKILLHRSSMKKYAHRLAKQGWVTEYLNYELGKNICDQLQKIYDKNRYGVATLDPDDFILRKRLDRTCVQLGLDIRYLNNPGFINLPQENTEYRENKTRWFMAEYYKWQRKRLNVLMDDKSPMGGKWSFDGENRKKVPKKLLDSIPKVPSIQKEKFDDDAIAYVADNFPNNPGSIERLYYPTTHEESERWLQEFLNRRLEKFGDYEDAIVHGETWLWHSVLTPMLNIGLLTPRQILDATMLHASEHEIQINSVEGFVRQIIGWREFMRATYADLGVAMRTTNHWKHHRTIPASFYSGNTGIDPIDDVISRILETGYCHHIERLMVLGGFMFLCEFDPNEIYRWFMEMFVDSYDWVMVPNVYGMSQNADGGLITTKPYFSGSSYIKKMSHYKQGAWCDAWDGLYWRWIWNHAGELSKNPRWAMMCSMARKMDAKKRETHIRNAEQFLKQLDSDN